MTAVKKYNLSAEEVGELVIDDSLLGSEINSQMIKDYIVALRANSRQWSACTKGRSEMNHSTKKPRPQKGSGNARQGYLGAPQFKGGGIVFGPKPKFDQKIRINQKERRASIKSLLSEKIQSGALCVLNFEPMKTPKTSLVDTFLDKLDMSGRRILFLTESKWEGSDGKYANLLKSMRNIPGVWMKDASKVSGYDVALNHFLVFMDAAIDDLNWLLGEHKNVK